MVSIYDVQPRKLIDEMAVELKKMPEIAPPAWAAFVKTGSHNMRPPVEKDWWYIRSAAVLRSVYKLGPIGVSKLRTKYGGRKNRGHKPDITVKASGNILRRILQKLEIIGFVKQADVGVHKGRIITAKGKSFVDSIVVKIKEPSPIGAAKQEKPKEEKKTAKPEIKEETKVEEKETKKTEKKDKAEEKKAVKKEKKEPEKKEDEK